MPWQFPKNLDRYLIRVKRRKIKIEWLSILSVAWIAGLAISILALWGFAELAEEVFDRETQAIDLTILQNLESIHTPILTKIAIAITFLGEPFLLIFLSLGFASISLWQRKWQEAIALFVACAGGISLNFWLKTLFVRTRPALWERFVDVSQYSFPSGHAMVSLIVYGFICYWSIVRYPAMQRLILAVTFLLVVAIGFTRLYLGVHWPTDVVAGYAAGLVWLFICISIREVFVRAIGIES
jgi:membrane-associated phospholipid phosphatase